MTTTVSILIAFGVYLLGMIGIGIWSMRQTKGADDFFLGGRGLSAPVAAMSAQASDMSGWLLMGLPGSVYALGTGQAWIAVGLGLGTIANWLIIARPLRAYTIVAGNSMTLPEFFGNRYHDEKKILLGISSVIIVIFFLVYTASALASGGKLFNTVFGLDYHIALFLGAAVILIYTFMGGFLAVCSTDFFQGLLMLIAILAVPVLAWGFVGGDFHNMLANTGVNPDNYLSFTYNGDHPITAVEIISNMAWGLGYCGMPHILIRFMAIRSEKELKKSSAIAIVWVVLSLGFTIAIGLLGRAFLYPEILGVTEGAPSAESVFIEMIQKVFIEKIPIPFIAGLFICGILAAVMSTADSQLLAASSAVSSDLLGNILKKKADKNESMVADRVTLLLIAVVAVIIARNPDSSVFNIVSFAWAGFGAVFGPVVLFALFWKRTNWQGALAGMISGGVMVFVWKYLVRPNVSFLNFYELLPAFLVSCAMIVIVSLATKAPSKEIIDEFETVQKRMAE